MAIRNYLKVFADGHTEATKFKPLFQLEDRTYAGYNPDVLVNGQWCPTSGGDELVTNGTFDSDTAWSYNDNGVIIQSPTGHISGGVATIYSTGTFQGFNQYIGDTSNAQYVIQFDVTRVGSGALKVIVAPSETGAGGVTLATNISTVGRHAVKVSSTNGWLTIGRVVACDIDIDNISVYETEIVPDTEYPTQFTYMAKDDKLATFLIEDGQPVDITFDDDSPSIVQNVIQAGRFISQDLVLSNLTTVDPFILGAVWNDSNTLKISQG